METHEISIKLLFFQGQTNILIRRSHCPENTLSGAQKSNPGMYLEPAKIARPNLTLCAITPGLAVITLLILEEKQRGSLRVYILGELWTPQTLGWSFNTGIAVVLKTPLTLAVLLRHMLHMMIEALIF